MKKVKRVNITRRYSKSFKKARVAEYERGEFTVQQLSRMYGFSHQSMYNLSVPDILLRYILMALPVNSMHHLRKSEP